MSKAKTLKDGSGRYWYGSGKVGRTYLSGAMLRLELRQGAARGQATVTFRARAPFGIFLRPIQVTANDGAVFFPVSRFSLQGLTCRRSSGKDVIFYPSNVTGLGGNPDEVFAALSQAGFNVSGGQLS